MAAPSIVNARVPRATSRPSLEPNKVYTARVVVPTSSASPRTDSAFQAGRLNGSLGRFEQRDGGRLVVFPRPSHLDMISQHCYVTVYRNTASGKRREHHGDGRQYRRPGWGQHKGTVPPGPWPGWLPTTTAISDDRAPLVLLHGLTFDRSLWRPSLAELSRIDPGRRVLALDLPGHGASPGWPSYDIQSLADGVHRAVDEAGLQSPVVVGHSIAAIVATAYAAQHPTRGIINVDQPLQVAPFADLVQSLAGKLRGPAFPAIWQMFAASMHIELLPEAAQELVRSSCQPRQELVLAYWRETPRPARQRTRRLCRRHT